MKSFVITIICLLTIFLLKGNAKEPNPMTELWKDASFQKEFMATYGTLAGYEPELKEEEKETIRTLIKFLKVAPGEAIKQLAPQVKKDDSAAFDFILANLYFQEGQLDEAENFYKSAIRKYPNFRRAYKNLGLVNVQKGDFEGAIKSLSKSMELGLVDGRAYGLLGYSYLTVGNYFPAEAAYRQAILMQPEVLDWKLGLARCLLETEQYEDAVSIFNSLIISNPNNSDYWSLQSNAYLGLNESLNAARNLEVVDRLGASKLETLSLLGDIYINNSMPNLALAAYLKAMEHARSKDLDILIKSSSVLIQTANFEQANTIIEDIRSRFSDSINDKQELKLLTHEAKIARFMGKDDLAANLLIKIIERDLLNGDAIIELAKYYVDQSMLAEAFTRFEQARNIEGFERPALIAHAQALVSIKKYAEATPLLVRALELKSDRNLEEYTNRVKRASEY
jgi:tetratricopeptide (TPR) repeat protein